MGGVSRWRAYLFVYPLGESLDDEIARGEGPGKEGTSLPDPSVGDTELTKLLRSLLTADEIARGVVYLRDGVVAAGTTLRFGEVTLQVPWDAYVAFVDREPAANWGHPARYLMIRLSPHEAVSTEARFPPFVDASHRWRVVRPAPPAS